MDEKEMAVLYAKIRNLQKEYDIVFLDMLLDLRNQVMIIRVDGGYVACRRGKQFVAGQPQLFIPGHVMQKILHENTFDLEPTDISFLHGKVSNAEFDARPKPKPGHKGYKNKKRNTRRQSAA